MIASSANLWTVVIPVKPTTLGKSRLRIPGVNRAAMAHAVALDTIEAAAEVAHVVVVTADTALTLSGVHVVREKSPTGLEDAIALGLAEIPPVRRAVLLGDLPGLVPADLVHALEMAESVSLGSVPDEERVGTTLVTARKGALTPLFGIGSWRRHIAAGFAELPLAPRSTLRRDVDTVNHLVGHLGPRTAALLATAARR
ncbi:MAG TPA: 2-phospho-L-lactate guanylyltransferase [Acidimicrobiaceae bacterium]|nr:2-phospho-L-lactate guanylyltransferase [Acidimicrobiaceae bacterium]